MRWPLHTSGDAELPAEYGLILSGPQDGAEEAQRLFFFISGTIYVLFQTWFCSLGVLLVCTVPITLR